MQWRRFVLCILVNKCRFISASPWRIQLDSRGEKNTLKKFVWELEALTEYLLHHFESNFVLHAAARLSFMVLFCRTVCFTRSSRFIRISVFSEPVLFSFIMFIEIFQFVDFCVSVRIMGVSVRAWFDALKRDSHAEMVRLDRYAEWFRRLFWDEAYHISKSISEPTAIVYDVKRSCFISWCSDPFSIYLQWLYFFCQTQPSKVTGRLFPGQIGLNFIMLLTDGFVCQNQILDKCSDPFVIHAVSNELYLIRIKSTIYTCIYH